MMRVTRRDALKIIGATTVIGALGLNLLKDRPFYFRVLGEEKTPTKELSGEWIGTACWIGKQDCGLFARVVDGRLVGLVGDPNNPRNRGRLCPKGVSQIAAVYSPYRVKSPLKRVNEKGRPGEWVEISWDEALDIVADNIRRVMDKNPKLIVWQKGRSKQKSIYDKAFVKTLGITKIGHGAYCSDTGYRACEYTVGLHGVLHPDFRYCKYLIAWGWNIVNAGGNKLCWITWPQELVAARERGMKVVLLDPRREPGGPHVDEWVPIRPGTDLAFWLAVANVLVENGYIDVEFLKKYTNAPFLVKEDGYFIKVDGKELVWDAVSGAAKPYDEPGIDPALEGEYVVDGIRVKPAYQVFKEHISQYTPEWAEGITDVPAETIRRIAIELGENAMIGSSIVVDGVKVPYRPVAVHAYHVSQQELGFQAVRACLIVFMLLGAISVAGGVHIDFPTKQAIHKNYKKLENVKVSNETNFKLEGKYFPINSVNPSMIARVMVNPEKYGVKELPEMMILHMANPLLSFTDQDTLIKAYSKLKFVVVISPWLSETADYFADIVLPTTTLDKFEGPLHTKTFYEDAYTARLAPIPHLFNAKDEADIYAAICDKLGLLDKFIDNVIKEVKIAPEYKDELVDGYRKGELSKRIIDAWARTKGLSEGIEYFKKKGTLYVGKIPANIRYAVLWDPPFLGIKLRLYGEGLKRIRDEMRNIGLDKIYWQDYTPLPTWRKPTLENSPPEYNLYLISFKLIEFKQSRATFIPQLAEIAPEQYVVINRKKGEGLGIRDGDLVWVESHNAVTGETRRIKAKARLIEGIRPDTVGMPHHYGFWVDPVAKDRGPTPNTLFFTSEGYVSMTQDQTFHVKVRIWKA